MPMSCTSSRSTEPFADDLPPELYAPLRFLIAHFQPKRNHAQDAAHDSSEHADAAKAKSTSAGHLFIGSIVTGAAGAQAVQPVAPRPLQNSSWAAATPDEAAVRFCQQCMSHINNGYMVRSAPQICLHCEYHTGTRVCTAGSTPAGSVTCEAVRTITDSCPQIVSLQTVPS